MDAHAVLWAGLSPLFHWLWFLIPLFLLAVILKSPWFKGVMGELQINQAIQKRLDPTQYHLLKNVTLPVPAKDGAAGTTQIDHVLVSPYGIFVIETKNMSGWIFGQARQTQWTQKMNAHHSQKFQNPLFQNYKHVKTLQAHLGLADTQLHSLVVFTGSSTFKTQMPDNVVQGRAFVAWIKQKQEVLLLPEVVAQILQTLTEQRLDPGLKTHLQHRKHVKALVAEKAQQPKAKQVATATDKTVVEQTITATASESVSMENVTHDTPQMNHDLQVIGVIESGPVEMNAVGPDAVSAEVVDQQIQRQAMDAQTSERSCPRCGSEMVLRQSKKGANAGESFWGCSGFPKCRMVVKV